MPRLGDLAAPKSTPWLSSLAQKSRKNSDALCFVFSQRTAHFWRTLGGRESRGGGEEEEEEVACGGGGGGAREGGERGGEEEWRKGEGIMSSVLFRVRDASKLEKWP